jgi:hypothetical protein
MIEPGKRLTTDECCALVGQFMLSFALMESAINNAFERALSLDEIDAAIVLANIDLSRKLYILRSAVSAKSVAWQKKADKDIKEALDKLEVRNIVAHTVFGPTDDGRVRFLTVKARSKLQFPDVAWSLADFVSQSSTMRRLTLGFDAVKTNLTPALTGNILSDLVTHGLKAMNMGQIRSDVD